ncbi:hypothetical protein SANTM175S_03947 [Streptomyces antimycoticus]
MALARAIVTRPEVLFGDEPTGALDSQTSREVLALLRGMVGGKPVIMVTHDPVAAWYARTGCCSWRTARCTTSCTPRPPSRLPRA